MSTLLRPPSTPSPAEGDPFYLGWRYVPRQLPDGNTIWDQVPLTPKDVLHPQEDDFIVNTIEHNIIRAYLHEVFLARLADRPDAVTTCDTRIDWQHEEIEPLGPDLAVFVQAQGVDPSAGTFRVKDRSARSVLTVEVTSPSSRKDDLDIKVAYYHQLRVPLYVIVDLEGDDGEARLIGYQYSLDRYLTMPADDQGRLWIPELNLLLGLQGRRVISYDGSTGAELGDYTAVTRALEAEQLARIEAEDRAVAAEGQVEAEKARADMERARADAEKARAEAELQARLALEARLRELEARLGNGTPP